MADAPNPPDDHPTTHLHVDTDQQDHQPSVPTPTSPSPSQPAHRIHFSAYDPVNSRRPARSTNSPSDAGNQMSPGTTDRVFPIRSVVSVDPTSTPAVRNERQDGYFHGAINSSAHTGRRSRGTSSAAASTIDTPSNASAPGDDPVSYFGSSRAHPPRLPPHTMDTIVADFDDSSSHKALTEGSIKSSRGDGGDPDDIGTGVLTSRFTHVVTDEGHAVITGRDGDPLQRCEDEPIHVPGAIQSFGLLIALAEEDGKYVVRIVSENSYSIIGYSPKQLFALDSFTDILSDEQADNLLDHIDFVRDEETDVEANGPELFTISIRSARRRAIKLWCAMHVNERNKDLIICEFELENDTANPPVASDEMTPEIPEDTLNSNPTTEEYHESTRNMSKPLRVLRSARKHRGEAAAMEVFNIMSQVQEQLAAAPNLDVFLKVLVGVVKELTGFHRVMIYQFDKTWNGRVVTELVDPRATKDLYKGLHFPASDIPKQARDMYKVNRVRLLYDRDQETARLVCRTVKDLEEPLDLTYGYLRAMSPIHIKYLTNMAVRASMSISINAFDELWGLISCHSYGAKGMRVSFPIRKMCRLVGDTASRNIERLSYASRLQARKLINTVPTQRNPSGYIIASSEDLLKLFDADFGLLCIQGETKMLGALESTQEGLVMLEYLKMRKLTSVMTSQDLKVDFPDLIYPPGFSILAGMLLVPLSASGSDFICFFRKGQLREVKWAGNPYEKYVREGTKGFLEPRKSFKTWSETVVGKCRDWTEDEVETAAVLCLVYGKFIEVWRQKEAALQNSQLTKLLLANSAHEVRTPLNAIINYLEIALEGSLDQETREYLAKSHSASKSLIYVINDLLDLTKTEEGGALTTGETMDWDQTLHEATDAFTGDAQRKGIEYRVTQHPGIPKQVIGDQRKVRQAISNVIANAIKHTSKGSVEVEASVAFREDSFVHVEVAVADTGVGMSSKRLDALFRDLEQVQTDDTKNVFGAEDEPSKEVSDDKNTLGLGLAIVARIVRNMNGQLRLKSEEGHGSRFVIQFPFEEPNAPKPITASEDATPMDAPSRTPLPSEAPGEVLLVDRERADTGHSKSPSAAVSRRASAESINSKKSMKSLASIASNSTQKSDVDRLIEALQEPHLVESKRFSDRMDGSSMRPSLEKRKTFSGVGNPQPAVKDQARHSLEFANRDRPGEHSVKDSAYPIKPVKVPEDEGEVLDPEGPLYGASGVTGEVVEDPGHQIEGKFSTDKMNVLVAEDDPVNSRIIKKRLERLGHIVHLTVNGEVCANAYSDKDNFYDVVLMDMQMPIVDGLTSTKMIRETERTNDEFKLSPRASLNGRVPIFAVSASLVEKERQTYIDAGFDGWILKPIAFTRLSELMTGIVDSKVRKDALYQPGAWEKGGWFDMAKTPVQQHPAKTEEGIAEGDAAVEALGEEEGPSYLAPAGAILKTRSAPQLRSEADQPGNDKLEPITDQPQSTSPAPIEDAS